MDTEQEKTAIELADEIGTYDTYPILQDTPQDPAEIIADTLREILGWTVTQATRAATTIVDGGLTDRNLRHVIRKGRKAADHLRLILQHRLADAYGDAGIPHTTADMRSYSDLLAQYMRGEVYGTPWGQGDGRSVTTGASRKTETRIRRAEHTKDDEIDAAEGGEAGADAEAVCLARKRYNGRNVTASERRELAAFVYAMTGKRIEQ